MVEWVLAQLPNLPQLLDALLKIVGGAAVIATLTPNKSDDKIIDWAWKIVNFAGANFGKAKNNDE